MNKKEAALFFIKHYLPHKRITLAVILLISLLTFLSYQFTLSQSKAKAMEDLALLLKLRHAHLERYFSSIDAELSFWSQHGELRIAAEELNYAWQKNLNKESHKKVSNAYLSNNPYPHGQRKKLYTANNGTPYDLFHNVMHHLLKPLTEKKQAYTDVMFINAQADIIYSVQKNQDYGQNVLHNTHKNHKTSPLAKLYRQLSNEQQASIISDALLYSPADYQPLLFAGKNIYHLDGGWLGVLVFAIPLELIGNIMQSPDMQAAKVNSYIVGQDQRLLTLSTSHTAKILEETIMSTTAIKQALAGKTGTETLVSSGNTQNNQEKTFLTAYRFFAKKSSDGQHWALIAEKPLNEVHQPNIQLFIKRFTQIMVLFLVAFVVSSFTLRWIEGEL